MLGVVGCLVQEAVTGKGPVESILSILRGNVSERREAGSEREWGGEKIRGRLYFLVLPVKHKTWSRAACHATTVVRGRVSGWFHLLDGLVSGSQPCSLVPCCFRADLYTSARSTTRLVPCWTTTSRQASTPCLTLACATTNMSPPPRFPPLREYGPTKARRASPSTAL